jgi:hypothetical protein
LPHNGVGWSDALTQYDAVEFPVANQPSTTGRHMQWTHAPSVDDQPVSLLGRAAPPSSPFTSAPKVMRGIPESGAVRQLAGSALKLRYCLLSVTADYDVLYLSGTIPLARSSDILQTSFHAGNGTSQAKMEGSKAHALLSEVAAYY